MTLSPSEPPPDRSSLPLIPPPEWAPHAAVWLAWPARPELWTPHLTAAQNEFVGLGRAIADPDPKSGRARGERLRLLVLDDHAADQATRALGDLSPEIHRAPYGDIWLRDTGPIFGFRPDGGLAGLSFRFNGWGGRYRLPHDERVAEVMCGAANLTRVDHDLVLEGGAVEFDGEGTLMTTRSCLLNPNRNPELSAAEVDAQLRRAFGVTKVIWLSRGLVNDHTDGHIDTLARFVAPGRVVCMAPSGSDDPNAEVLEDLQRELAEAVDARGRRLEVVTIASPGRVIGADGRVLPASYVNFYVGNTTVVVPTYGRPSDRDAVAGIDALFEDRRVVGRPAQHILEGGGAFHCITQQEPFGDHHAS